MKKEEGQRTKEALIIFDDENVEEGIEGYKNSLIGKFVSMKPFNKRSLQQALANI